jgi:SAM-dependent methyltransferase
MWNERYSSPEYFYGSTPNEQFKSFVDSNPPGKLLLPAEGEGRNALYAALKGWEVIAVDYSEEARKKAIYLAKNNNVNINYRIGDIKDILFEPSFFDYCACVFMHMPHDNLVTIYEQLLTFLKQNGKLLIVGFNKKQLIHNSGGPKNEDWLFSSSVIKKQFELHRIIHCNDIQTNLSEGKGHEGIAEITVAEIQK